MKDEHPEKNNRGKEKVRIKMAKKIALFNHKGGVSKTTTTFNLAWMLASKGKRVLMADTDPRCNLTGLILGHEGPNGFKKFYENGKMDNLRDALAPAFESSPKLIEAVDCLPVEGCEGLFLLPSHLRLSEYEITLGMAQESSGFTQTLQNLPGAIPYLLEKAAKKLDADYVLIDMAPSLSSINQNLLMTSDFFAIPTHPDYFSMMAMESLAIVLPQWYTWAKKAQSSKILRDAEYPFPQVNPKFLGIIVQKYRTFRGVPPLAIQEQIKEIERTVSDTLIPSLQNLEMMLPADLYDAQGIGGDHCLASIPDFETLIAKSEIARTPVFVLSREQLGESGVTLKNTLKARDHFKTIFSDFADKIIGLTNHASGN